MQPNEALNIAAQVAVTLAGFAGIVVVFRPSQFITGRPSTGFAFACCSATRSSRSLTRCSLFFFSASSRRKKRRRDPNVTAFSQFVT
jgi:hypothetical protein